MTETRQFNLPTGMLGLEVTDKAKESLTLDKCLGIGARRNTKRGYLFVSKLLGKHIPVSVERMQEAHVLLVERLRDHLKDEPTWFIGMAETATGLGHGVYEEALMSTATGRPWHYSSTTRYPVEGAKRLEFKEEHSHSVDQLLHVPTGFHLDAIKTLVLIDDEISTGKTLCNLESSLREHLPALERVIWVTLTCFVEHPQRPCVYLLKGRHSFEPSPIDVEMPAHHDEPSDGDLKPLLATGWGRLGVSGIVPLGKSTLSSTRHLAGLLRYGNRNGEKRVLVIGQGEFMHAAYRVALELKEMGIHAEVQSTTRSPVMVWGAIERTTRVPDPFGAGVEHFAHNLHPENYAFVFITAETAECEASAWLTAKIPHSLVIVPHE